MAYDGTLKFDTRIDTKSFMNGLKTIKAQSAGIKKSFSGLKNALSGGINTKSAVKSIESLKNVSESAKKSIESILSDVETSTKSKAAKIAGVLKKEGYGTSESMKSAWSLIERQVKSTGDKNVKNTRKSNVEMEASFKATSLGIQSSFKKLLSVAGSLVGIWQVINFARESIELGSDIAEIQNVVDTAFSTMSYKIEDFSKTCIESFGMSKLTAKQMASTFMAMSTGMGQGLSEASDMAVKMTGRLGDVASFYNNTMSEVDTIGRAVITGETEPLKNIGVVMTETNLDAWTLSKGYDTLYSKMDQTNKLAVREAYFLDKTNLAAGDFLKTQDSWANQTRILSERFKEFKSIIGTGLINVLKPVVVMLNNMLSILINVANTLGNILSNVFGIEIESSSGSSQLASDYSDAADSADDTLESTKELSKQLSGIDNLNNISSSSTSDGSDSGSSTSTTASDIISVTEDDNVSKKLEKWNELLAPLKTSIDNFKASLSNLESFNSQALEDFYNNFVVPFGEFTLSEDGIPRLIDITSRFNNETDWNSLNTSLSNWFSSLEPIAELTFDGLADFYDYFIEPMAEWTIGDALPQVLDILTKFNSTVDWEGINSAFEDLWKAVEPLGEAFGQGIIDFFSGMMSLGADVINKTVPGGISALAKALSNIDPDIIKSIATALATVATSIAAIKVTQTMLTNLAALKTSLQNLSTMQKVAISVTLAISAIDWAHMKWEDVFSEYDYEEVHDGLELMFQEALGDNFLSDILADTLGGLGAIFSGYATPKEWIDGFNDFAYDCWDAFKYRVKSLSQNNKWVNALGKVAVPAVLSFSYSKAKLKAVGKKVGEQIKKGDFVGAAITIGVNFLGYNKIAKKLQEKLDSIKTLKANVTAAIKSGELKKKLKEQLAKIGESAVSLPFELKANFSPHKIMEDARKLWKKSAKILWISLGWSNKYGFFSGIVKALEAGLNAIIQAINKKLTFKIPKWVPVYGGKKWSLNLKEIDIKLPKLATGAVIPPNKEFLAVLGDQTNGTNIEAPLSTIQKALANELDKRGSGSDGNITLVMELDGDVVYKKVVSKDKQAASAKGKRTALAGG